MIIVSAPWTLTKNGRIVWTRIQTPRCILITGVNKKKGQALIETLFMLPFIIAIIMLVYGVYSLTAKEFIVQKYLKGVFVGRTLNRFEITAETSDSKTPTVPSDGRYFFKFEETNGSDYTNYSLDGTTVSLLTLFLTDEAKKEVLSTRLKGKKGRQTLGACMGGGTLLNEQTSYDVFNLNEGDTCGKK